MNYYQKNILPNIEKAEQNNPICNKCINGYIDNGYDEEKHILIQKKCQCLIKRNRYIKFAKANIPSFYWNFFDCDFKENKRVINKIISHDFNSIFLGPSFTGKTVCASHILMNKIENEYTGFWWKYSELIELSSKKFDEELFNFLNSTLNKDVIVIDDLGWTNISSESFLINQTMKIIRNLFETSKIFIITTNYSRKVLEERFGSPLCNTIFHKDNIYVEFKTKYS
jgi:DNA replication protein DnaC